MAKSSVIKQMPANHKMMSKSEHDKAMKAIVNKKILGNKSKSK